MVKKNLLPEAHQLQTIFDFMGAVTPGSHVITVSLSNNQTLGLSDESWKVL